MGKIKVTKCEKDGLVIEGLLEIEPMVFKDERGEFFETYNHDDFKEAGLNEVFVQDNQSKSTKGVLRGLNYQKIHPQARLTRVIRGRVFDVAVDLRENSKTFGKWFGSILSDENNKQLYVPKGFAHGFLVLSDEVVFAYKCTEIYYPGEQEGLLWCDPDVGIEWPIEEGMKLILADKDKTRPRLNGIKKVGKY